MTRDRDFASNAPDILQGQTVFPGTRVMLDILEAYRRRGRSLGEFLEDYPSVSRCQAEAVWGMDHAEIARLVKLGAPPVSGQ